MKKPAWSHLVAKINEDGEYCMRHNGKWEKEWQDLKELEGYGWECVSVGPWEGSGRKPRTAIAVFKRPAGLWGPPPKMG